MTNQLSTCVNRELFDAEVSSKNNKLSTKLPLKLFENDDYLNSDENLFWDNNCLESDESDSHTIDENNHDLDCSLGSMNSVYLDNFSNKTSRKEKNHSYSNDNSNKSGQTPTNSIASTKTQISTKKKNENTPKKCSVVCFYGPQKFTQRNKLPFKLLKRYWSKIKLRRFKLNKLRRSWKSMYCKRPLKNIKKMSITEQNLKKDEKLIHHKSNIPLINFNYETVNMTAQKNINHVTLMKNNNPSLDFNDIERDFTGLNGFDIVNDFIDDNEEFYDPRLDEMINVILSNDSFLFDKNNDLMVNVKCEQMNNVKCELIEQKYAELFTSCNEH